MLSPFNSTRVRHVFQATAGEGPKFSVFGVTKDMANSLSEGASYGLDQSQPIYSPYGPYSPITEKSLYTKVDNTKFYKGIVAESNKRLSKYDDYISKKSWMDVKGESTRFLYSLRKAVNGLATTKESKALAKKVFVDLEALTYAAQVKDQAAAVAALAATKADLGAFMKTYN